MNGRGGRCLIRTCVRASANQSMQLSVSVWTTVDDCRFAYDDNKSHGGKTSRHTHVI